VPDASWPLELYEGGVGVIAVYNTEYNSRFAPQIKSMLELRAALGRSYRTLSFNLQSFDRFVCGSSPEANKLTQELAQKWCADGASATGSGYKMAVMRDFGKYLVSIGIDAFVFPASWIPKQATGLPHIFTDEEIRLFFAAADSVPPHFNSPMWEYVIPVIFRIIFACGLRPQEARLLKRDDLDYENCVMLVTESKGNKDRLLPICDDLAELCRKYDVIADCKQSNREFFFQAPKGGVYRSAWLTAQFHRVRRIAGGIAEGSVPYDLRHNFATQTIMRWVEEKRDFNKWLPYLSTYMGHETFKSTFYYVHLLPERLSACDFTKISGIIPEVVK
jgi:integrase